MTAVIDDTFAAALSQDAALTDTGPAVVAAPPRKPTVVDPDAPHGRAEDGSPNAPYGIGKNGRPRIKPAGPGRGARNADDAPRVSVAAAAAPVAAAAGAPADYTGQLDDLADGMWMLLSGFPARGNLKVKLHAQAAVLQKSKPKLVHAGNIAARHHEPTAQLIEKLTTGNAAWMLPVMFGLAPFVAQSLTIWRAPAEDLAELAAGNEADFKAMLSAAALLAEEGAPE